MASRKDLLKPFLRPSLHIRPGSAARRSPPHFNKYYIAMAEAEPVKPEQGDNLEETPLPKLSAAEFRQYNRMAEHMEYFVRRPSSCKTSDRSLTELSQHNNFRQSWNIMYNACCANKRPAGMSIRQFIGMGVEFCHHLDTHHSIEEVHIFPLLAKKMPAFRKELELLTQHKQIHKGMDKMEAYLEKCRGGEEELRLDKLKEIMNGFGEVLWKHLEDEVHELRAENMRKYWTLDEMRRLPI